VIYISITDRKRAISTDYKEFAMTATDMKINGEEEKLGAATKLRRFLEQSNKILFCPGVYDGFSARIALSVGFDALYMVIYQPPSRFQLLTFCRLEQAPQHPDSVKQI
jgi:hypothetical protein